MTCGIIEPDAGAVILNGVDVTAWPMYRRARDGGMGYLAQEQSVFRKLTVEQNLLAIMEMLGIERSRAPAALPGIARGFRHRQHPQVAGHGDLGRRKDGGWKLPAA